MDLNANVLSSVVTMKEEFEDKFTKKLVTSSLRNIIERATPYESYEKDTVNNNNFKDGVAAIADNISTGVVDAYKKTEISPSGSFFDSMINCIGSNVSLEADSRMKEIMDDISLGNIDTNKPNWMMKAAERFEGFKFNDPDVNRRFKSEFNNIISVEEAGIIDDIRNDVKNSVAEAETKSNIVEDTVNEINDIKAELDPPEDKPVTATDTDTTDTGDDTDATSSDTSTTDVAETNGGDTNSDVDSGVDGGTTDESPIDDKNEVNAEQVAEAYIPILPRKFKSFKNYSVETMAFDFCRSGGNIEKEIRIRLDSLKLALGTESLTENNKYLEKFDDLETKAAEAVMLSRDIESTFSKLGLTQNGMYDMNSVSFECAKQIIGRFNTKNIQVSVSPKEFTSTENILANAFDIVQIKQNIKSGAYGKKRNIFMKELESRESAFYKEIINVNDKAVQDAAINVLKLQDVKLDRIINIDFVKDYKMSVKELNVGNIKNLNDEVFKRVSEKLEKTWGRKLTDEEADIIRATTNGEDATEIVPSTFEKLVIKFGKDEMNTSRESGNGIGFTDKTRKKVYLKAKLYTSAYKTLEHLGILNKDDESEFNRFINAI